MNFSGLRLFLVMLLCAVVAMAAGNHIPMKQHLVRQVRFAQAPSGGEGSDAANGGANQESGTANDGAGQGSGAAKSGGGAA